MACEKEYQDFVEAGKEWERIEKQLGSILPLAGPISEIEDVTPTVLTQEMLNQWKELDKQRGPAREDWLAKAQEYLDCKKASGG